MKKLLISLFILFISATVLSEHIVNSRKQLQESDLEEIANLITSDIRNIASRVFHKSLIGTEIIAEYIESNPNITKNDELEKLASRIIKRYKYIDSIALTDANGHIEKVYTAKNDGLTSQQYEWFELKSSIEHAHNVKQEALKAIGPVHSTQQNQLSFILTVPYRDPNGLLLGYVNSLIKQQSVNAYIDKDISQIKNIEYQLLGFDLKGEFGKSVISNSRYFNKNHSYLKKEIRVLDFFWTLNIYRPTHDSFSLILNTYSSVYFVFILFGLLLFKLRSHKVNITRLNEQLYYESITDSLTSLPNRRWFEVHMMEILTSQEKCSYCIAILDLDHFKEINDSYGHNHGDRVLKSFCKICASNLRSSDNLIRWGGEEFVLIMSNTSINEAKMVCDRVRKAVSESIIESHPYEISTTVSIGVTSIEKCDIGIDTILHRADLALYKAKRQGRNLTFTT